MAIYNLCFSLSLKTPSYGTILIWVKKIGHYKLEAEPIKADDWIIIIDESIEFGHDKLLVIYGVRSSSIDFTKALDYKALTPLTIVAKESWTGSLIEKEIRKIELKIGRIIYAVADGGNAISKSLKLTSIPHINDITHKFAWFLKKLYKEHEDFVKYTKTMAAMRGKLSLSKLSHILPPNQRFHSRFMNIEIISDWGVKVLRYLDCSDKKEIEYLKLKWVFNFRELIAELLQVSKTLNAIMGIIKTQGLSSNTIKQSAKMLKYITVNNVRTKQLKIKVIEYLKESKDSVKTIDKLLCTSDIIESSFGKYKNYISNNPMTGITDLSLCMAAFTCNIDEGNIKKAMESTKYQYVIDWSKRNIGITNLSKRKMVLKNERK